jgi:endonuclease YncB( thermonuclease family)
MHSHLLQSLALPLAAVLAISASAADQPLKPATKSDVATARVDKDVSRKLSKVVIMLTGDTFQTRYVEEALTVQLLKQGVGVVSRLRVERLLAEEMVKNRTLTEKDPRKAIHATAIAKNAGATGILVGTTTVRL